MHAPAPAHATRVPYPSLSLSLITTTTFTTTQPHPLYWHGGAPRAPRLRRYDTIPARRRIHHSPTLQELDGQWCVRGSGVLKPDTGPRVYALSIPNVAVLVVVLVCVRAIVRSPPNRTRARTRTRSSVCAWTRARARTVSYGVVYRVLV